jgi:hypothetical protein
MKMPKFILRIGFQEFAVPHNSGLSALMSLLEDALPVDVDFHDSEITLQYTAEDEASLLASSTMVSIKRIPPGMTWKRKSKEGVVEIIRPVAIEPGQPPRASKKKQPRLNGSKPKTLQLEFGR